MEIVGKTKTKIIRKRKKLWENKSLERKFDQSIYLYIYIYIYISIRPSIYLSVHLYIYPCIYISILSSIYLSVHLSIYLSILSPLPCPPSVCVVQGTSSRTCRGSSPPAPSASCCSPAGQPSGSTRSSACSTSQ